MTCRYISLRESGDEAGGWCFLKLPGWCQVDNPSVRAGSGGSGGKRFLATPCRGWDRGTGRKVLGRSLSGSHVIRDGLGCVHPTSGLLTPARSRCPCLLPGPHVDCASGPTGGSRACQDQPEPQGVWRQTGEALNPSTALTRRAHSALSSPTSACLVAWEK